ncbi:MAG: polysaccharide biosynthesis PFTS motif protein [Methanoregula sp.]|nr:polysaccharide biosynthesis PFTS motif protein [Methanoregula sp.]
MGENVVVFEQIGYFSTPLLLYYHLTGNAIFYLNSDKRIENSFLFKHLSKSRENKKLKLGEVPLSERSDTHERVLKDEKLERQLTRDLDSLLVSYLESENVYRAFLKKTSIGAWRYIEARLPIENLVNQVPENVRITVICGLDSNSVLGQKYYSHYDKYPQKISIGIWGTIFACTRETIKKTRQIALLAGFPFWVLFQLLQRGTEANDKRIYLIGMRVYDNDLAFFQKLRSIDFLIDGKTITPDDVLFCLETEISPDYQHELVARRYHTAHVRSCFKNSSISALTRILKKGFLKTWVSALIRSLFASPDAIHMTSEALYSYLTWVCFCGQYRIKNYVVYNDTIPVHIIRNLVLSREGIQTWYFLHSSNVHIYYKPPVKEHYRHIYVSHLCYDHLVSWSESLTRWYASHPNGIGKFQNFGCLWSENVCLLSQTPESNVILQNALDRFTINGNSRPEKIIGVFDTTFGGETILTVDDIIAFIRGIIQLLDDIPEIGVIVKMKWTLEEFTGFDSQILESYTHLKDHPRCYLVDEMYASTSEVNAAADLVISACFTSTTLESLGARRKAIYFDALGKFNGFFFDGYPRLVAHSYSSLLSMTRWWLFDASDREFERYLDEYVKGEIDSQADGMAITRFREYLKNQKS